MVNDSYKYFFILGRGRSGTTLLRTMLNQHDNINVPNECFFMMNIYYKYKSVKLWNENKKLEFYNDIWFDKRLEDNWVIDKNLLKDEILNSPKNSSLGDLCKLVYIHQLKKSRENYQSVKLIGDKNPIYSLFPFQLLDLFPDSKFIYMTRNVKDNILSYQKVKFDSNNNVILANRWESYNLSIFKFKQQYPNNVHIIRYEDLVLNAKKELSAICEFLEVTYDEKMLKFYESNEFDQAWHKNLAKPIDGSSKDKWIGKMSKKDIQVADYLGRHMSKKLGYEITQKGIPIKYIFTLISGTIIGNIYTLLEKLIFRFPLKFRSKFILFYRTKTGSYNANKV